MRVWAFGKMIRSVYFEPMNFDRCPDHGLIAAFADRTLHAIRARAITEGLKRI